MQPQEIKKTRLGDILVKKGLITNDQLQDAIHSQKTSNLQLGEILIGHKWVSQWQINRALKTQSKLRNAVLTSILSLSPLALVGCGGASESSPDQNTTTSEQVVDDSQAEITDNSSGTDFNDTEEQVIDNDSSSGGATVNQGGEDNSNAGQDTSPPESVTQDDPNIDPQDPALGSVQFSWSYPTHRMDGSEFDVYEVKHFRIYQISDDNDVNTMYEIDALDTDYTINDLSQGQYHFSITVVDTNGSESGFSDTVSLSI